MLKNTGNLNRYNEHGRQKMRDLHGNNYGTINDNSQTLIINRTDAFKNTEVEKEEVSIRTIRSEKVVELILGIVSTIIAVVIKRCQNQEFFAMWGNALALVIILLVIILGVLGVLVIFISVFDLVKIFSLSKNGSFVEFESKRVWIYLLLTIFQTNKGLYQETRTTGKCYKNIDGKIYRIKSKKCPLCETEPIGKMYLEYSNEKKTYYWKCSQNQAHRVEFDYKKII